MFTYAHVKWFYGQSERAYYLNYFIIRLYPLPTWRHSFFRNLPPLFLLVLRVNRSEYHFHWTSLLFFLFVSFQHTSRKTSTTNAILHLNFCKNFLLHKNSSRISVFLRFPTKTQINRPVKRYEAERFRWYRQCSIPCYVILENCSKISRVVVRQHKKLAFRRIVFLSRIKAREDANRSSIHSLEQTPKDKKMTSFFAEIYSLIRFEKDGTESSAGGRTYSIDLLCFIWLGWCRNMYTFRSLW